MVSHILLKIDEWREQGGVHYVYLFYNRHSSMQSYRPTGVELLPVNLRRFHRLEEEPWPSRSLPTYTMDRQALFSRLLDQYLFVVIFRACAESQASEHGGRLAAMQAAERNLEERLGDVTMDYRRARQTVITSELLDLVAGFEAIETDAGGRVSVALLRSNLFRFKSFQTPRSANKKPRARRGSLFDMARLGGFEPPTAWFVARYSIQLSYSRLKLG